MARYRYKKLESWIFIPLVLCFVSSLSAVIIEVDTFQPLEELVSTLDERSLVVFDVDETLILPKDAILHPAHRVYREQILKELVFGREQAQVYAPGYLESKVMQKMRFEVIDSKSVLLVKEIQKRSIPTIACTAADAGPRGVIESGADWRIAHLRELDIDFSPFHELHPHVGEFEFLSKKGAAFKQGILFSSKYPKGLVLVDFLKTINFRPNRVVVIDDRIDFLHSIEFSLRIIGIDPVCHLYTGSKKRSPPMIDEGLVRMQSSHLLTHGEWLNDDEARSRLQREIDCR